jgi:hypothetical protein
MTIPTGSSKASSPIICDGTPNAWRDEGPVIEGPSLRSPSVLEISTKVLVLPLSAEEQ